MEAACEARTGAFAQHLERLTSAAAKTPLPAAFGQDCDNGHGPRHSEPASRIAAKPTASGLAARPRLQPSWVSSFRDVLRPAIAGRSAGPESMAPWISLHAALRASRAPGMRIVVEMSTSPRSR